MAKDTKRSDYSVDPLAGMRSRPANDGHGNDDSGQSPHCECFGQPLLKHDSTIVLGDRLEASEHLTGGNPGLPGHPQNGRWVVTLSLLSASWPGWRDLSRRPLAPLPRRG